MAMNVFELFATLGLNTEEYEKGLEGAERSASNFGENLRKGVGVAAGVTAGAITATTAATVAGTKAFITGVSNVASYGDEIEKTSQKLGLTTQAYQEWDYVMNIAGTSMSNMQMGVKTLTNKLDDAKNGSADALAQFEALGLSLEDLQNMTREEVFESAIFGFQGMADSTERAALANDLFGRSGQELTPLFNMTAEETRGLIDTANEYGLVMSGEAVEASATFQDSLTTLQGTMNGLKNNMLSEFLPSFSTIMDGLSAVFAGDSEGGLAMIEQGVSDLADNIAEVAPRFMEIGGTILTALASSITENLPTLLTSGAEAVVQISNGIIENLPQIIPAVFSVVETVGGALLDNSDTLLSAGVDILLMLVDGIANNVDTIVPAIVTVTTKIVSTLMSPEVRVPLLKGGIEIITGLIGGLAEATPELIGMIPEIIADTIVTLEEVAPAIGEAALELLGSLGEAILGVLIGLMGSSWEEIGAGFDDIMSGTAEFFSDIWKDITGFFGDIVSDAGSFISDVWNDITGGLDDIIGSVSSFGSDIWNSFTDTFDNVKETVSGAIDDLLGFMDFDWSLPELKLPHFSVSGGEAPWGFGGQGSLPKVSISWYKKAMNTPYLLDSATIFGAANGQYLGGGEAGAEMIYSHSKLMADIGAAIDSRLSNLQFTVPVYIGSRKIDQQIVMANARNTVVSGGR